MGAVRTRDFLAKLAIPTLLLVLSCNATSAQSTADAIRARLKGQPLYLRGCWGGDDKLKLDADGQPEKQYKVVPFTEAGIEVRRVKLSNGRLRIEGPRIGLCVPGWQAPARAHRARNDHR
jgi:hypothetical protein